MKKYSIFALVLVLTLSVFTGCGRRRQEPASKNPTTATVAPTMESTEHMTVPTETTTHGTEATMIPDVTDHNTTESADQTGTEATDRNGTTDTTENGDTRARTMR